MKVKSDDKTVSDILAAKQLRVPRFQRPYEWTKGEVEDFWEDVAGAGKDYFIGSMVIFPSIHDTSGLVDGQQRITTITLLLCAVRDALRSVGADNEANGLQNLIERPSIKDNQLHFVLQTDEERPYLRFVQAGLSGSVPKASDAEALLAAAYSELVARVGLLVDGSATKSQQRLLALRDKVLNLHLIWVEVDNEDDATVIFQTLNSRGRDLEAADLVKSHLFSLLRVSNPANDPTRKKWNSILDSFSESKAELPIDRFLLHSWLSRYEYLARADLGKQVRKRVKKGSSGGVAGAGAFLDGLVLDARLYRELQESEYRLTWTLPEQPMREAQAALFQTFRVRQPLPWLLALWRQYDQKELRLKHVLPAIQTVERFHFLATAVTNLPSSGGVSKMYASRARLLTDALNASDKQAVLEDLRQKLADRGRLPTEAQFTAAFAEIRSSRVYTQQARLALYILRKLHVDSTTAPPDLSKLTVEHLDPQGAGQATSDADVARLGNLILIPQSLNEELANKPFAAKLPLLQTAAAKGVPIDPYVLKQTSWGAAEIESRTKSLALTAYRKVWRIR